MYVNVSPTVAVSAFTSLFIVITGVFASGSSLSPVSSSFTVALFIIVPLALSSTTTVNLTSASSPTSSSTGIPWINSAVVYVCSVLLTVTVAFSLNFVPAGALSFTIAVPAIEPVFVTFIVYSSSSPTDTEPLFAVFSVSNTAS